MIGGGDACRTVRVRVDRPGHIGDIGVLEVGVGEVGAGQFCVGQVGFAEVGIGEGVIAIDIDVRVVVSEIAVAALKANDIAP